MLAFFVLTWEGKRETRYSLAVFFALLATLTRLSALFFALPVIVYSLLVSGTKTRLIIIGLCVVISTVLLLMILQNPESAYWGLLGNHMSEWGDMSIGERVSVVIKTRIPKLVERYLNYFLLWCGIMMLGLKRIYTYLKTNLGICVVIIGLLLFVLPNLASGFMLTEYFVPFLYLLIPIVGILFAKVDSDHPRHLAILLRLMLGGAVISGLIWHSTSFIDLSGDRLPIEEIREAA